MAIAEARQWDVRELTVKMGRAAVEGQMNGVYANLLRPIAPHNFCGRFEQLIKHFYNFGPLTATPVEGGARVVREGVPLCIAEWWSLVTQAFAEVPLVAQGATDVTVEWRVAPSKPDRGVHCGTVIWDVRWKAPPAPVAESATASGGQDCDVVRRRGRKSGSDVVRHGNMGNPGLASREERPGGRSVTVTRSCSITSAACPTIARTAALLRPISSPPASGRPAGLAAMGTSGMPRG